jgi:hypothetical protein
VNKKEKDQLAVLENKIDIKFGELEQHLKKSIKESKMQTMFALLALSVAYITSAIGMSALPNEFQSLILRIAQVFGIIIGVIFLWMGTKVYLTDIKGK